MMTKTRYLMNPIACDDGEEVACDGATGLVLTATPSSVGVAE